jgi:hypothetical protein
MVRNSSDAELNGSYGLGSAGTAGRIVGTGGSESQT